jgi:hypothetical protein
MSSETIQIPAIFTGFSSRSDGGASLRFATQELNETDFVLLKKYHQTFGYVLFRPNAFSEGEIPQADANDKTKSPAQRLRAALFVLWRSKTRRIDFEVFYRQQMEAAIDRVKACLD